MTISKLISMGSWMYVIGVRGTGLHWKYAKIIGDQILDKTDSKVVFYGQIGKVSAAGEYSDNERVSIIPHDEKLFSIETGIGGLSNGVFGDGLKHRSYYFDQSIKLSHKRFGLFKATIETTRGCHFGCKFCFINHGTNYSERFSRRKSEDVVSDVKYYTSLGVNNFWFYDSELVGADKKTYFELEETLEKLSAINSDKRISIMIYSRADTILKFDNFELLRKAGVDNILMGIESFSDPDSKAMRKSLSKNTAIEAITKCVESKIFFHLSFILFNRGSTISSIKENIDIISDLYSNNDFIYLGQTHYLSYQFESDWKKDKINHQSLSGKSNLIGSTSSTLSSDDTVIFDPSLEPVAEIFRILNYEQIRKLSQLTIDFFDCPERSVYLHRWATLLSLFVINMMSIALKERVAGRLTLDTVKFYESWVYLSFQKFNCMILPDNYADTITDKTGYDSIDWNVSAA